MRTLSTFGVHSYTQMLPLWVVWAPMLWVQLHTITVTAFAAKRERKNEKERLWELSISLFTCGCESVCAAAADVATKRLIAISFHLCNDIEMNFLSGKRERENLPSYPTFAIYRSPTVPILFESNPVHLLSSYVTWFDCLSQVARISQLWARINALSYTECNSCGLYHISVPSLLYIICN